MKKARAELPFVDKSYSFSKSFDIELEDKPKHGYNISKLRSDVPLSKVD